MSLIPLVVSLSNHERKRMDRGAHKPPSAADGIDDDCFHYPDLRPPGRGRPVTNAR